MAIEKVLTINEAARLWGKDVSTLRRMIQTNHFKEGVDYRKSGGTWIIEKKAMEKFYGKLKE